MFTLYLYEGGECIAQIQDIFELNIDLRLNAGSQVKLALDAQSPYIKKDLLKMRRPVKLTENIDGVEYEVMCGVIRGVEAGFTQVELILESWRALLEKRLVNKARKRQNASLETVVRELIEEQNEKAPLPFSVEVESGSTVSLEVGEKAILSSVMNSLIKEGVDIYLIGETLKIGKKIGVDRTDGTRYKEFRYDTLDPEGNTIEKAKLVIDAKSITNKIGNQSASESIANYGLLEENKSNEDENAYLSEHKDQVSEFTISVGDDFFYDVELGDKVKVVINGYNELMQFDGTMKIVGKKYISGDLAKIEYTVSTQRVVQEGFIGTIKQISEKVSQGGVKVIQTTPPPTVDLSGYATSSAVNQALQTQNQKIDQKADSSFVSGVAQTAQTALNTATSALQTANSKADANHNHDDRYYTETEIDSKLANKADVNHSHNFPTSLPASDVYPWAKQQNKPSYEISEIAGLSEALQNTGGSVSLTSIDIPYTTDIATKNFRIASRYQLSNITHGNAGHQLQILWGDLQAEGTGHDGGRGLFFGPAGNPYLHMQGTETWIGRTDGWLRTKGWINPPNYMGIHREANTDYAQIIFNSNHNDDTTLDFKLGDDGSELFRFLFNDTWRAIWNYDNAIFKQRMFVRANEQFGLRPSISLAIGDSDTGFNRESDGVLSYRSNGASIQTFHQSAVPVVAENIGRNTKIKKLTQAQYDAMGGGRPDNTLYYITD